MTKTYPTSEYASSFSITVLPLLGCSLRTIGVSPNSMSIFFSSLRGFGSFPCEMNISFLGAAAEVSLDNYWQGGSRLPAIQKLLELTLKYDRDKFCSLILKIVEISMIYSNRSPKITREEIIELNEIIKKLEFKIPELWKSDFLNTLPSREPAIVKITEDFDLLKFKNQLVEITSLKPQPRGFAFEKFLNDIFVASGLSPRGSFRIIGEQIDGSFILDSDTYLLEAKWQNDSVSEGDLLEFYGKVSGKATWSRGLFICYNNFSSAGLIAFSKGKSTNIIGMTSQDIFFVLEGKISLPDAIRAKARWAAETGEFYKSIYELDSHY